MTKEQIIEALKYHEVPEKSSDVNFIEDKIIRMYNCFYACQDIIGQINPPVIELNNVCFDTYDEGFRALFNVVTTIGTRSVVTTIEDFDEIDWDSHDSLADQLLEIEVFASKLRVLTTDDLQRWEDMAFESLTQCRSENRGREPDDLSELHQEIMLVKM